MRLYLGINIEEERNGFTKIDPVLGKNPLTLDEYCDKNECEEIYGPYILNYIGPDKLLDVTAHYISKLRHGGKILLGGTDLYNVAVKIVNGDVSFMDSNRLLYNTLPVWNLKQGCYSAMIISDIFENAGLKITKKYIDGDNFIVEGCRE